MSPAVDTIRIFETYIAFNGDVARTAVACNLTAAEVEDMAHTQGWKERAKEWTTLKEGSTADVAVQVNRAVNFVQAHRLRSLIDKVVGELSKLEPTDLISRLSTVTTGKGGTTRETFNTRALTDLVKAAESAHLMTQRALGDTVQERPATGETRKGSSIALLVGSAMSAAEDVGVDSVSVVRKTLGNP